MNGLRLGLCCQFVAEPIKFRNTTVKHALSLSRPARLVKLAQLCRDNADALSAALEFCVRNGIGDFRVNSQILPLKSHPVAGYKMTDLPDGDDIVAVFRRAGKYARDNDIRISLHPDQFILLSSADGDITERSCTELEYHGEVAEWIGADVINIHGGGAYGDRNAALKRVERHLARLSDAVRSRLTFENDDRTYSPADLLPLCERTGVPFVYDVHHHRCLPDALSEEAATQRCLGTWNRDPMFHLSSPKNGWDGPYRQRHHDMIDPNDVPACWLRLDRAVTVEVEAKAKEKAVLALRNDLNRLMAKTPE